jgi:hypothetical protein
VTLKLQTMKTMIVIAAVLAELATANAREKIDNLFPCSEAAKAFDTKNLAAVKEVGD